MNVETEIKDLLLESLAHEDAVVTRITVDQYTISISTYSFSCETNIGIYYASPQRDDIFINAEFEKRMADQYVFCEVIGKRIREAFFLSSSLHLLFSSGEKIILKSLPGVESLTLSFLSGRGPYLIVGSEEEK